EEQAREDDEGRGRVQEEVVPLDGGADRAGDHGLDQPAARRGGGGGRRLHASSAARSGCSITFPCLAVAVSRQGEAPLEMPSADPGKQEAQEVRQPGAAGSGGLVWTAAVLCSAALVSGFALWLRQGKTREEGQTKAAEQSTAAVQTR